ncbi:MAG TPA: aspartate ammonia-lyase [bacterium]|nr:aspartate ammonia-lyase [bacterium]
MAGTRIEKDSLGSLEVPADAYWGAQTARAVANFPVSGLRMPAAMVRAYARIKRAAAETNGALAVLAPEIASAVARAAAEVEGGALADQFVVDVYQAGAGTSFHMNVNEVLANRALEILGRARGDSAAVSPNDHVNAGQSTNDTFPTAMRLACLDLAPALLGALQTLARTLDEQAAACGEALKSGRTHLQDAVPMRIAQEIGGWAAVVRQAEARVAQSLEALRALPIGGTAIGTGMNADPAFPAKVVTRLSELTALPLAPAPDRFARIASMSDFVAYSATLRGVAIEVGKIANDLRLLASGPFTGIAELVLPAVQPGSSIMPGKVNPSIAEMTNQVCYQVIGLDATVAACAGAGQLELNVMMPVVAFDLCHATSILGAAVTIFAERCVRGISWDLERCRRYFESSTGMATILNPHIGYLAAAEVAKQAAKEGRSVVEIVRERKLLDETTLAAILAPKRLTEPGR